MTLKTDLNNLNLASGHKQYLLAQVEIRWRFLKSNCHTLAYYLDAKYLGNLMSMSEKLAIPELIFTYLVPDDSDNPRNEQNKQNLKDKFTLN